MEVMEVQWPDNARILARAACRSASRGSCSKQKQLDLEVQRNSWNQIHTIHSHTSYLIHVHAQLHIGRIHSVLAWLDCLTSKMLWQCAISFRWDAALVLLKVHKCFPANQHVEFDLVEHWVASPGIQIANDLWDEGKYQIIQYNMYI